MDTLAGSARSHFASIFNPSRHGYLAEALVFRYLSKSHVVRAPEFATVDGAIYLNWGESSSPMPPLFADRVESVRCDYSSDCCINFDVKNKRLFECSDSLSGCRGMCWRANNPTTGQRTHCAFIIVVFNAAKGPSREWVALMPIELFDGLIAGNQMVYNDVYSWSAADPALHPFTFPIDYLPVAISNVRKAALGQAPYVNPWNRVVLHDWTPRRFGSTVVSSGRTLNTAQHTASTQRVLWLQEEIDKSQTGLQFEYNDVQPLLGDFTLIDLEGRRFLFEHKANQFVETSDSVTFTLHWGVAKRNPFHPLRLWDFIFWHNQSTAYCIPRNCVPRSLCEGTEAVKTVSRGQLGSWRLELDANKSWLDRMYRLIIIPFFGPPVIDRRLLNRSLHESTYGSDIVREDGREEGDFILDDPEIVREPSTNYLRSMRGHGLHGLACLLQDQCAQSGEGVVLPLWRHSPAGDYVFINWSWTGQEQKQYWYSRSPPVDLLDRRVRAEATICLPLVMGVFYNADQAGVPMTPPIYHLYGCEDQRCNYFMSRDEPFILLGDTSPAYLSTGATNLSHPYLTVASEHLQRPPIRDFTSWRSLRYWFKDCEDPMRYQMPISDIYQMLICLVDPLKDCVNYVRHQSPVLSEPYRQTLQSIWQRHAQAASDDASCARNIGPTRERYRYLIKPASHWPHGT